jgi:quercetin dioxygenase-like cupin family protein
MGTPRKSAAAPVLAPDIDAALLEAIAPISPSAERTAALRARLLRRVNEHEPRFVTVRTTEGTWLPLAPKVAVKILDDDGAMQAFLLRLDPGATLAAHDNPDADEQCVVLEGTVRLGDVEASAGDYHLAPAGSRHGMLETATGCLLFIRTRSGAIPHGPQR